MMKAKASFLIAGLLLFAAPIFAHHAFNAEYDASKSMRWAGTVTKVEWTNPHARFYVDVKDKSGAVANWDFELGSPLQLRRQGWSRDSLKPGDQITVEGYPAKDGAKLASAKKSPSPMVIPSLANHLVTRSLRTDWKHQLA